METVMLMGGRNGEPRDDINIGLGRDGSMMLSGARDGDILTILMLRC